jgi:hypothetical protein
LATQGSSMVTENGDRQLLFDLVAALVLLV